MMMKKDRNRRQVRERERDIQNDKTTKKHNKQQKIEDEQRKKGKKFLISFLVHRI